MPNAVTAQSTVEGSLFSAAAAQGKAGVKAIQTMTIPAVMIIEERQSARTRGRSPDALAMSALAESPSARTGTSIKLQRICMAR